MRTLYFVSSIEEREDSSVPPVVTKVAVMSFGIRPYRPEYQSKYDAMTRAVSLTEDVGWDEAHLQMVLRKADFWDGFPVAGATLVRAEFKPGSIDQRIDLLFLATGGELVPCELKIRGNYPDSHGQLVRYVADLSSNPWDLDRVRAENAKFLTTIKDPLASEMAEEKMRDFIAANPTIPRTGPLPVRPGGVIMDVKFGDGTQQAIRYLNGRGFMIELFLVHARVTDDWQPDAEDRWMRLDFETVSL